MVRPHLSHIVLASAAALVALGGAVSVFFLTRSTAAPAPTPSHCLNIARDFGPGKDTADTRTWVCAHSELFGCVEGVDFIVECGRQRRIDAIVAASPAPSDQP